jgi:hypothetical protein
MIDIDIPRSAGWFCNLATAVGLPEPYFADSVALARDILSAIASEPSFVYYQGYDRYVFISCLAAMQFAASHGLERFVGEALAFSIARAVIKISNLSQYLRPDSARLFESFERQARPLRPDIYVHLDQQGLGAMYYAHRWKLLWFADEHAADGILIIWDNILARLGDLPEYLDALALAHLKQVVVPPGKMVLEAVQRFTDWNVEAVIRDAAASAYESWWRRAVRIVLGWARGNVYQAAFLLLVLLLVLYWLLR